MNKYKAVLFDLDGTLIDSSEGITKSVQYSLKHFGIEEDNLEKLSVFIGPPLKESYPKYYGIEGQQLTEIIKKYRERYSVIGVYECALYPGAEACLRRLREQGYRICLASSKPETMCETILGHFHVRDLFDEVVGATLDGKIDTKSQVLDELFRRMSDISKEEMVLVGDTIFDVAGAKASGIASIGVDYGFGNVEEMRSGGALTILSSLPEVADYLCS